VVINPTQDVIVELYEPATISAESNITVRPLFSENRYTIDLKKIESTFFFSDSRFIKNHFSPIEGIQQFSFNCISDGEGMHFDLGEI